MHNNLATETNSNNPNGSTGPRTVEGKAASRENAVRHSLAGIRFRLLPGESQEDFDEVFQAFLHDHKPQGQTELVLVTRLAQCHWTMQRAADLATASLSVGDDERLKLMLRYQTTHERAFHAALKELKACQKEREERQRNLPAVKAEIVAEQLALLQHRRILLQEKAIPAARNLYREFHAKTPTPDSSSGQAA